MAMATSCQVAVTGSQAQLQTTVAQEILKLMGPHYHQYHHHHFTFPGVSSKCRTISALFTPTPSISRERFNFFHPLRAAATMQESSTENLSSSSKVTKYHFLVANAKFMLDEEEHFQELMRERLRNFGERNREQDFWLVIEPQFLEKFPDITKRLGRPAVALVSTDELWITFMKLRLDRVLRGEVEANSVAEALKSNPVELEFQKPKTWTAPYSKYEGPWWTPFLPHADS